MGAEKWTANALDKLEKRIAKEYGQASKDLQKSYDNYLNGYDEVVNGEKVHHKGMYERYNKEYQAYLNGAYHDPSGKYTDEQMFNRWWQAQEGRGQHYNDMIQQMNDRLTNAGEIAKGYTNNLLPKVWVNNNNAVANLAQESAMEQGVTGIRFDLVDEYTVKRLITQSREVKPYKPIALDLPKMSGYNRTKIQNALLEGILAGDSMEQMALRFQKVSSMNESSAIRNARTAVTGAQGAGKQARYEDLKEKGCKTTKIWVATEDDRTREEHSDADGQEQPYDQPFDVGGEGLMYPADPNGSDWNIYNCRCTTRVGSFDFESMLSDDAQLLDSINVLDENKLKSDLSNLQQKKADKENELKQLNKTYSGIWKNDVTLADWESKQNSIPLKEAYYNDEKTKALANGDTAKVSEIEDKLNLLHEFDIQGQKYYNIQEEINDLFFDMHVIQLDLNKLSGYDPFQDPYSQERKDLALWAKDTKEADAILRGRCGEVWRNATDAEKRAIYNYTGSYHPYNEPLRGIQYGLGGTSSGYKGVGNVDLDGGRAGKYINDMTDIINKSSYDNDIWLQRGCRYSGMDNFFGVDSSLLQKGTTQELQNELLGKEVVEHGFMSCGVAKGKGFGGDIIMNVYAPKGTNMMYAEPFSQFGGSRAGLGWDGVSSQNYFGSESEIILQQGTKFEVTKVERGTNGTVYVDIDVIGREKEQRWKKP